MVLTSKDGNGAFKEITAAEKEVLDIKYVNNVYKGKAVIIVNGDGTQFKGGVTSGFSIVTRDVGKVNGFWQGFSKKIF